MNKIGGGKNKPLNQSSKMSIGAYYGIIHLLQTERLNSPDQTSSSRISRRRKESYSRSGNLLGAKHLDEV